MPFNGRALIRKPRRGLQLDALAAKLPMDRCDRFAQFLIDDFDEAPPVTDHSSRPPPETRRALQLDALAAILPMDRRDRLAQILTDDDVATLKHLAREGMGENSLRALASDLAYLEAWAQAATRGPCSGQRPRAWR